MTSNNRCEIKKTNEGIFKIIQLTQKKLNKVLISYAKYGNADLVKQCISAGANVNAKDNDGFTPLMLASCNKHPEVVKLLCDNGANIHTLNNKGQTAWEFARNREYFEIVELLEAVAAKERRK